MGLVPLLFYLSVKPHNAGIRKLEVKLPISTGGSYERSDEF